MDCRVICDCGTELRVDENSDKPVCPNCQARYAVTVTRITPASRSNETD